MRCESLFVKYLYLLSKTKRLTFFSIFVLRMKFKASQIAEIFEGEIQGDPEVEVSQLAKIEEGIKGSLTFLY